MSFPLVPESRAEPSILSADVFASHNAEHGWLEGHAAPDAAVLLFHRGLAEDVADALGAVHVRGFLADYFLLDSFEHRIALVANFGIGAPAAVFAVEDLIGAGVRDIVCVGTSGGIRAGAEAGDIVLCDRALRDEGTSYHYAAPDIDAIADPDLSAELADRLTSMVAEFRTGTSWTTDAPYRETALELRQHRAAGVEAVEMELSAVFVVAAIRGAAAAGLLTVSDVLEESDWRPEFHAEATGESLRTMTRAAIDTLAARLTPR